MHYQVRVAYSGAKTPDGFSVSECYCISESDALVFLHDAVSDPNFYAAQFFVSVNKPKFYPGEV